MTRRAQHGFTLVELLVSITILSFMMMIAWSVLSGTVFARRNITARQERDHEIRVALAVMVRDLSSAYISANEDQNMVERRTLFVGEDKGDVDQLRFSTMNHQVLWADADESEQTAITYQAESDPDKGGVTNLIRREQRRTSNEPHAREPAEVDLLIRDVKKVQFQYWDWKDKTWKDSWDSTQADAQRARLPTRVKITLEVAGDDHQHTIKRTTEARLMLQEQLQFFAK